MKKFGPILTLFVILVLPLIIWVVLRQGHHQMQELTYLGPMVANPDGSPDSVYHKVGPFSFLNQDSVPVNRDSIEGRIVLASLFQCEGPSVSPKILRACFKMQEEFKEFPDVRILSFSVNPRDSMALLAKTADTYETMPAKWHMLRGPAEKIHNFVRDNLFLKVYEGEGGELGYVFSDDFRLIDREGHLRGQWRYDATNDNAIDSLITHVKLLEIEYANRKAGK